MSVDPSLERWRESRIRESQEERSAEIVRVGVSERRRERKRDGERKRGSERRGRKR